MLRVSVMRTAATTPDAKVTAAMGVRRPRARGIGRETGDESADGVARIPPQPIDADGGSSPCGMGDVSNRGE